VDVSYTLAADADGHCGVVQPGSVVNLPCDAVYTAPYEIHFTPCIDGWENLYSLMQLFTDFDSVEPSLNI